MIAVLRAPRRIVAALLATLLLQLVLLGPAAACATLPTDVAAAVDERAAPAGHEHHRAPEPAERQGSTDAPAAHCAMAMACLSLGVASIADELQAPTVAAVVRIDAAEMSAPRSAFSGPEPPPPRA